MFPQTVVCELMTGVDLKPTLCMVSCFFPSGCQRTPGAGQRPLPPSHTSVSCARRELRTYGKEGIRSKCFSTVSVPRARSFQAGSASPLPSRCAGSDARRKNARKKKVSGISRSARLSVSDVNRSPGRAGMGMMIRAMGPVIAHRMVNTRAHVATAKKPPLRPSRCHRAVKA